MRARRAPPSASSATAGANILTGGSGADTIIGGGGADTLTGGAGNDTMTYDGSNASIAGGADIDTLVVNGAATINLSLVDQSPAIRRMSAASRTSMQADRARPSPLSAAAERTC